MPSRPRHLLATCAAIGLSALAPAGALAAPGERPLDPPVAGPAPVAAPAPFRDRVLQQAPRARSAAVRSRGKAYRTSDGSTVAVSVSSLYADDPAAVEAFVGFLDSLPHGSELGRLRVHLATPGEIGSLCGGAGVLACYVNGAATMIVPGERETSGVSTDYVVTHEYGHHVAAFRSNPPFPSEAFGPKYWSSYQRVCVGVLEKRLFPGGSGRRYRQDPGENWAEAYARLRFPDQPWNFEPTLRPDAGALAAAQRDVFEPWSSPVTRRFEGVLDAGEHSDVFRFRLRLDGGIRMRLSGPAGADFDVEVGNGQDARRSRGTGSTDDLEVAACRGRAEETVEVRVVRRSGTGPFTVTVSHPG